MFTGIITNIGILQNIKGEESKRLTIRCSYDTKSIAIGASIACNGICLTVTEKGSDWFAADASPTTLTITTMKCWQAGQRINLERAMKMGDELGGHIVTGHVDGIAVIEEKKEDAKSHHYTLSCPPEQAKFIAAKGSVTLDGVSLTVVWAEGNRFGLTLIPHTLEQTNWGEKQAGDMVNLEVDVLARYVLKAQEQAAL